MGTREGAGILLMELHIILLLQEWHQNELNNILNVRECCSTRVVSYGSHIMLQRFWDNVS